MRSTILTCPALLTRHPLIASSSLPLSCEEQTNTRVSVHWLSNSGQETFFYTLNKACSITQETSVGNVWHVREDTPERRLICALMVRQGVSSTSSQLSLALWRRLPSPGYLCAAPSACISAFYSSLLPVLGAMLAQVKDKDVKRQLYYFKPLQEGTTLDPSQHDVPQPDVRIPECYTRVLETDLGIPVVGYRDVSAKALEAAEEIIRNMLKVGRCPSRGSGPCSCAQRRWQFPVLQLVLELSKSSCQTVLNSASLLTAVVVPCTGLQAVHPESPPRQPVQGGPHRAQPSDNRHPGALLSEGVRHGRWEGLGRRGPRPGRHAHHPHVHCGGGECAAGEEGPVCAREHPRARVRTHCHGGKSCPLFLEQCG